MGDDDEKMVRLDVVTTPRYTFQNQSTVTGRQGGQLRESIIAAMDEAQPDSQAGGGLHCEQGMPNTAANENNKRKEQVHCLNKLC